MRHLQKRKVKKPPSSSTRRSPAPNSGVRRGHMVMEKPKDGTPEMRSPNWEEEFDWTIRVETSPTVEEVLTQLSTNRERRNKDELLEEVSKIKERVKKVITSSEEEEARTTPSRKRGFLLGEKLMRMSQQKKAMDKILKFIEDCANRFSLLTEVNEWLWKDHHLLKFYDEDEDVTEEYFTMEELDQSFVNVLETLTHYDGMINNFLELLHKLINRTGLFQGGGRKSTLKLPVYEEATLLKSNEKWNAAVKNIAAVFEDAIRWIKNPAYKNAVRTGFRQYRHLMQAVLKKSVTHAQTKKTLSDLKKRIENSKAVKDRLEREAAEMEKRMLQLTKQVSELTGNDEDGEGSLMKKRAKELEDKWKAKEQEVSGLEVKINELQDELERAQGSDTQNEIAKRILSGRIRGRGGRGLARHSLPGQQGRAAGLPFGFQGQHGGHALPGQHGLPNQQDFQSHTPVIPQVGINQPDTAGQQQLLHGNQQGFPERPVSSLHVEQQGYMDTLDLDNHLTDQQSRYDLQGSNYDFSMFHTDMVDEDDQGILIGEFGAFSNALKDIRTEEGESLLGNQGYMERMFAASRLSDRAPSQIFYNTVQEREARAKEERMNVEAAEWLNKSDEPPPEGDVVTYYKNLVAGLKKQLKNQLIKNRDPNRFRPGYGADHAGPRITSIQREATQIFRTMELLTIRLQHILKRENLQDSSVELQKFSGLVVPQISADPMKILPQLSMKVADFVDGVAGVLSGAFISMRMRTDIPEVDMGPATHVKALTLQLDDIEQAKRHAMDALYSMGKVRNHLKGSAVRKLHYEISLKAQKLICKDKQYLQLMERYKIIWDMLSKMEREVEILNGDFESMVKKKVVDRQQLMVSKVKPGRKTYEVENLFLSMDDIRQNLIVLDYAFGEQKISKQLYGFAVKILHHALEMPEKRMQYLFEKYVFYCTFKDILADLDLLIHDETTVERKLIKLLEFKDKVERKYRVSMYEWKEKLKELNTEKLDLFGSIWQLFNTILLETGIVLIHPLLQENKRLPLAPLARITKKQKRQMVKPFVMDRSRLDMPRSLDGSRMPIFGRTDFEIHQSPGKLSDHSLDKVAVQDPKLVYLDVNQRRIMAQRTLEKMTKKPAPMKTSQGYIITCGEVAYMNDKENSMDDTDSDESLNRET